VKSESYGINGQYRLYHIFRRWQAFTAPAAMRQRPLPELIMEIHFCDIFRGLLGMM